MNFNQHYQSCISCMSLFGGRRETEFVRSETKKITDTDVRQQTALRLGNQVYSK